MLNAHFSKTCLKNAGLTYLKMPGFPETLRIHFYQSYFRLKVRQIFEGKQKKKAHSLPAAGRQPLPKRERLRN